VGGPLTGGLHSAPHLPSSGLPLLHSFLSDHLYCTTLLCTTTAWALHSPLSSAYVAGWLPSPGKRRRRCRRVAGRRAGTVSLSSLHLHCQMGGEPLTSLISLFLSGQRHLSPPGASGGLLLHRLTCTSLHCRCTSLPLSAWAGRSHSLRLPLSGGDSAPHILFLVFCYTLGIFTFGVSQPLSARFWQGSIVSLLWNTAPLLHSFLFFLFLHYVVLPPARHCTSFAPLSGLSFCRQSRFPLISAHAASALAYRNANCTHPCTASSCTALRFWTFLERLPHTSLFQRAHLGGRVSFLQGCTLSDFISLLLQTPHTALHPAALLPAPSLGAPSPALHSCCTHWNRLHLFSRLFSLPALLLSLHCLVLHCTFHFDRHFVKYRGRGGSPRGKPIW